VPTVAQICSPDPKAPLNQETQSKRRFGAPSNFYSVAQSLKKSNIFKKGLLSKLAGRSSNQGTAVLDKVATPSKRMDR